MRNNSISQKYLSEIKVIFSLLMDDVTQKFHK